MDALYFLNPYLRVIHIVAGALWAGIGFATVLLIIPAQVATSQASIAFTKALYSQTPYGRIFPIVGGTTVLAGLLLYATGSHLHFSQLGNMVLGIGALVGIAAAGHGGAGLGKLSVEYYQLAQNVENDPKNENVVLMDELGAKLKRSATISLIMILVALVFMSSARYL